MEIPLNVKDNLYSSETVTEWQSVWSSICDMCYYGKNVQEDIVILPGQFQINDEQQLNLKEKDHCDYYAKKIPTNDELITLDHTWKKYSRETGPNWEIKIVPEFKNLYVPAVLFYTLGVESWFKHCFPNCKITYW